jgi:L-ribulose-5-phosphate 4-epimerase
MLSLGEKSMDEAEKLKRELCDAVKHLFERKLIFSSEGNLSVRQPETDIMWITPSRYKGRIEPKDLVKMDLEGNVLEAPQKVKPSIEHPMHRTIYKKKPNINAVVHTHSPMITGLMIAGAELQPLTVEAALLISKIKFVPFAIPGSRTGF